MIVWGATVLLVGTPALYLARERVLTPLVLRVARSYVESELDAELSFERLGGDWWSEIELEGFSLRADGGPLRRVDDGRLRARYSLVALVRGDADWLEEVELFARGIDVELGDLSEAEEPDESGAAPASIAFDLRAALVTLEDVTLRRSADPALGAAGAGSEELHFDHLHLKGGVRAGRVTAEKLALDAGRNRLELTSFTVDTGSGSWEEMLRGATGALSVDVSDAASMLRSANLPRELRFELAGDIANGRAALTGRIETEGGSFVVERGELVLGEPGAALSGATLDVASTVDCDDLAPFARLFGRELAGRLDGQLTLAGPVLAPRGSLRGRARGLVVDGIEFDSADVDIRAGDGRVEIVRLDAHAEDGLDVSVRGTARLDPLVLEEIALELEMTDVRKFVASAPEIDIFTVSARMTGELDALSGEFEAYAAGAVVESVAIDELRAEGSFDPASVTVARLVVTSGLDLIEASGRVALADDGRFEVELRELTSRTSGVRCALVMPNTFTVGSSFADVADLRLATDGGSATVSLSYEDGQGRVSVLTADFDTQPLLTPFLAPGLSVGVLDGRIDGTYAVGVDDGPARTALNVALSAAGVRLGAGRPEWRLDLAGALRGGRVRLERFDGVASDGTTLRASLDAPFDLEAPRELLPGSIALDLELNGFDASTLAGVTPALPPLTGTAEVRAKLSGSWDALRGDVFLGVERLELPGSNAAAFGACDLAVRLELGERVVVRRAELSGEELRIDAVGSFDRSIDLPLLLRTPEVWRETPLALDLELDVNDLAWVAAPIESVRRLAGRAKGNLSVTGVADALKWNGALDVTDAELRFASSAPVLREITAALRLDGGFVHIDSLTAEFGGAPVRVGGTVALPTDDAGPVFDLTLAGENLLLARTTELRVRADADLVVTGPLERLLVAGDLRLVEGKYARNIKLLRSLLPGAGGGRGEAGERGFSFSLVRDPPFAQAELSVDVTSANAFEIDTNLMRASVRPELHLGGVFEAPILTGPIYVGASSVSLPSGRLRVRSGIVEFRADDPFIPHVALSADMNAQGYRVTVQVEGPYDAPGIVLTSDPPLANDDLLLLVLTGRVPSEVGAGGGKQAAQTVAVYFAQDALTAMLFSKDADGGESYADRFEYEVGSDVTESGSPTGRALYYVGPGKGGEGRSTYLVTEFDEYDDVNYGIGIVFRFR